MTRRSTAQLLLVLAAASTFLTWTTKQSVGAAGGEGLAVLIVAVVAVLLIRIRWRPAWIAAGLIVAITGRQLLTLRGDSDVDAGIGLWVAASAALAATILLVTDMFAGIDRSAPKSGGDA